MLHASETAVEITKRDDSLDIWVDANNNGVRDDDDVNIFVTAGGGFYTVSPTFRHALDTTIQARIKELAVALLADPNRQSRDTETVLRDLALELVVKATSNATSLVPLGVNEAPVRSPATLAEPTIPMHPSALPHLAAYELLTAKQQQPAATRVEMLDLRNMQGLKSTPN